MIYIYHVLYYPTPAYRFVWYFVFTQYLMQFPQRPDPAIFLSLAVGQHEHLVFAPWGVHQGRCYLETDSSLNSDP